MVEGQDALREPIITSKGSRSRRTIATLTWAGLAVSAAVAWYGRGYGLVQSVSSEPVAFLLSAYAALSSIFAWMLYSPNRRSSDQSPALFISAAVTLLPPCIIAFCLMPSGSPYRFLLTLGVFILTMIAVSTPVPEEFFAVPRDRATYLRPISDAAFTQLRIEDRATGFENLASFSPKRLQRPQPDRASSTAWPVEGRDPWDDPFHGTGIAPVIPGSKARRSRISDQINARDRFPDQQTPADFYPQSSLADRPVRPKPQHPDSNDIALARERSSVADTRRETQPPHLPVPPAYRPVPTQRPSSGAAFGFRPAKTNPPPEGTQAEGRRGATIRRESVRGENTSESGSMSARNSVGVNRSHKGQFDTSGAVIVSSPAPQTTPVTDSRAESLRDAAFGHWAGDSLLAPSDRKLVPSDRSESLTASQRTGQSFAYGAADRDQQVAVESEYRSSSSVDDEVRIQRATDTVAEPTSDIPELRVERIRDEYGGEMVEGTARVRFLAGQKKANVHVPFAPALPGIPEVECESVGDQILRLKVPVRQSYGIRIEARRSDASDPLETEIGFAAVYSPPNRRS